jgi:undecaprenyl-diphosphatase
VIVLVILPLLTRAWRRVAIAVAVGIVLLVGFSRVALGAHYVTDVLGGWLVGAAWVALTVAAFQSWREDVGLRRSDASRRGVEPELKRELSGHQTA